VDVSLYNMDYVRDTMDWLMGKGRRKADKDPPSSDGTPGPPYLDPAGARFPTQFVTPALLPAYVRLPVGVDQDEWLATHTISFFEHVNLLYSCLSEYCNVTDCSSMYGPHQSQYYWLDEKGKKTKTPAACYVDFVMTFVHKLITDESVFPTKYGNTFPPNFLSLVKRAWRYLFHVIAHIYAAHFAQLFSLQLHPHLHTLFVHFSVFNKEFGLVEEEETRVLDDLLDLLLSEGMGGSAGALSPLTTSQSDSALHNKTRLDASPVGDGDSSGDAWSLPPTGIPATATSTFFGHVSPLVGSAPVPSHVDMAATTEPGIFQTASDKSPPPLPRDADATFDDSLDDPALFLVSTSPSHQIDTEAEGLTTMDSYATTAVSCSEYSNVESQTSRTATTTTTALANDSPKRQQDENLAFPTPSSFASEDAASQQQQPPPSFLTHRGVPSHSSGNSSNDKSRSSSGQSADEGGLVSNAQTLESSVMASSDRVVSAVDHAAEVDLVKDDDGDEEDKENLLPMGDLSTSAEGGSMILESMEVIETGDCQ